MNAGASCGYLSLGGHDGIFKVTLAAGAGCSLIGSGTSHNCALDSSGNITCSYSGFNDPDGDPDASTIEWKISGSVVGTGATLSGSFAKGDTVKCIVTPSDGTDDGSSITATRTISNSVPSIAGVSISPSAPVVGDTLSCSYAGFDDPDGDSDFSEMAWFINGSSAGSGSTLASGFR